MQENNKEQKSLSVGSMSFGDQDNSEGGAGQQGVNGDLNQTSVSASESPASDLFNGMLLLVDKDYSTWKAFTDSFELAELKRSYETPAEFFKQAHAEAESDLAETHVNYESNAFLNAEATWAQRFKAVVPDLIKGGLVVTGAIAESYVKRSPVIAGLTAAANYAKSVRRKDSQ